MRGHGQLHKADSGSSSTVEITVCLQTRVLKLQQYAHNQILLERLPCVLDEGSIRLLLHAQLRRG